jgi:hypothetical protein
MNEENESGMARARLAVAAPEYSGPVSGILSLGTTAAAGRAKEAYHERAAAVANT